MEKVYNYNIYAIKEGHPWTLAVAAIYRVEVDSAPMVAADLFPGVFALTYFNKKGGNTG